MQLSELILENDMTKEDIVRMIRNIDEDCKKYITEIGGWENWMRKNHQMHHPLNLFRGMRIPNLMGAKTVRENRAPVDTPSHIHDLIDDWFDYKFGHKYRSAAVFATGDRGEASNYGTGLFAIFPSGNYETCWSSRIPDLWSTIEDKIHDIEYEDPSLEDDAPEIMEAVEQILKEGSYHENADMREMLSSGHEIMIACRMYYHIPMDNESFFDDFLNEVEKMLNNGELK